MFFGGFPHVKAEVSIPTPVYDGNLILDNVILKPNIPTTEEEIIQLKKYDEDQRIKSQAKKLTKAKVSPSKATGNVVNKGYGRYECVRFLKDLLGIYGTWGNGARKLSPNGTGQVGDIAIFAGIVHAGLVIGRDGNNVTIREWITTKKGAYEQVRVVSVNNFRGFHQF